VLSSDESRSQTSSRNKNKNKKAVGDSASDVVVVREDSNCLSCIVA
jgi:hypothetical protein